MSSGQRTPAARLRGSGRSGSTATRTSAPGTLRAAASATPGPVPTSSSLVPAATPAASSSAPAVCAPSVARTRARMRYRGPPTDCARTHRSPCHDHSASFWSGSPVSSGMSGRTRLPAGAEPAGLLVGEVDAMLDYRVAGLREGGCHRGVGDVSVCDNPVCAFADQEVGGLGEEIAGVAMAAVLGHDGE
jgi:hypothetical protein